MYRQNRHHFIVKICNNQTLGHSCRMWIVCQSICIIHYTRTFTIEITLPSFLLFCCPCVRTQSISIVFRHEFLATLGQGKSSGQVTLHFWIFLRPPGPGNFLKISQRIRNAWWCVRIRFRCVRAHHSNHLYSLCLLMKTIVVVLQCWIEHSSKWCRHAYKWINFWWRYYLSVVWTMFWLKERSRIEALECYEWNPKKQ